MNTSVITRSFTDALATDPSVRLSGRQTFSFDLSTDIAPDELASATASLYCAQPCNVSVDAVGGRRLAPLDLRASARNLTPSALTFSQFVPAHGRSMQAATRVTVTRGFSSPDVSAPTVNASVIAAAVDEAPSPPSPSPPPPATATLVRTPSVDAIVGSLRAARPGSEAEAANLSAALSSALQPIRLDPSLSADFGDGAQVFFPPSAPPAAPPSAPAPLNPGDGDGLASDDDNNSALWALLLLPLIFPILFCCYVGCRYRGRWRQYLRWRFSHSRAWIVWCYVPRELREEMWDEVRPPTEREVWLVGAAAVPDNPNGRGNAAAGQPGSSGLGNNQRRPSEPRRSEHSGASARRSRLGIKHTSTSAFQRCTESTTNNMRPGGPGACQYWV